MTDGNRSGEGMAGWLSDPESVSPTILILGGFLTAPPMYGPLVRRLLDRGAAGAGVAGGEARRWRTRGSRGSTAGRQNEPAPVFAFTPAA